MARTTRILKLLREAGLDAPRSTRKAIELWGDPVVDKASVPGTEYGGNHPYLNYTKVDPATGKYKEFPVSQEQYNLMGKLWRRHEKRTAERYGVKGWLPEGKYPEADAEWARIYAQWEDNALKNPPRTQPFITGEPVTVRAYHGSNSPDIDQFRNELLGRNTGANSAKLGHFFSGSPETANSPYYTGHIDRSTPREQLIERMAELNRRGGKQGDHWVDSMLNEVAFARVDELKSVIDSGDRGRIIKAARDYGILQDGMPDPDDLTRVIGSLNSDQEYFSLNTPWPGSFDIPTSARPEVQQRWYEDAAKRLNLELPAYRQKAPTGYPVMLNMRNPLVSDWDGGTYKDRSYSEFIRQAKDQGHDGAILLNTTDGGPEDNIFVAMDPTRIRSVNAAFDPANIGKADIMGNADPRLLAGVAGAGIAGTAASSPEHRTRIQKLLESAPSLRKTLAEAGAVGAEARETLSGLRYAATDPEVRGALADAALGAAARSWNNPWQTRLQAGMVGLGAAGLDAASVGAKYGAGLFPGTLAYKAATGQSLWPQDNALSTWLAEKRDAAELYGSERDPFATVLGSLGWQF